MTTHDAPPPANAAAEHLGSLQANLESRQAKLERIRERGIDPYPPRFRRSADAAAAIAKFEADESAGITNESASDSIIQLAGRITSMRVMGRAAFLDLRDASGVVQAMLRQNVLGADYELLFDLDLGDFLGVAGRMMRTRTGQPTIEAQSLTILAKGMRPLPEKWHGLRDVETRYRQRYLDLIANPEVADIFTQRSRIISGIRRFFDGRGFVEVDTPILVPIPAGAHARPFVTHHNALDEQLYLRIATELYLKRLIVGGLDKVYEIGRVFRNEGIDQDHNPEFTLLESYEAYADYNDVMELVESLVSALAQDLYGKMQVAAGNDTVIDFTPPWPRLSLPAELERRSGVDLDRYPDAESLTRKAADLGLQPGPREARGRLIDKLLSVYVEPHLLQPTFLIDYPEDMSPLAKGRPDKPGYVERFEAFANGMEIANSYTELNDPAVQRARFAAQERQRDAYNDDEADRTDADFLTALEYGMPPTGGLGIGIDRLVMLLTGQDTIRDVLLFPQMRSLQASIQPSDNLPIGAYRRIPLSELAPVRSEKPRPPVRVRCIDGQEYPTRSWADLFAVIAEWLIARGDITHETCPIRLNGATRHHIHFKPEHGNGINWESQSRQLSNGLLMFNHGPSDERVRRSQRLLQEFGYDPADFLVAMR